MVLALKAIIDSGKESDEVEQDCDDPPATRICPSGGKRQDQDKTGSCRDFGRISEAKIKWQLRSWMVQHSLRVVPKTSSTSLMWPTRPSAAAGLLVRKAAEWIFGKRKEEKKSESRFRLDLESGGIPHGQEQPMLAAWKSLEVGSLPWFLSYHDVRPMYHRNLLRNARQQEFKNNEFNGISRCGTKTNWGGSRLKFWNQSMTSDNIKSPISTTIRVFAEFRIFGTPHAPNLKIRMPAVYAVDFLTLFFPNVISA
ncbi:hypothetical protein EV360DRAFT_72262 [Lentinula raphanica]|nr:hypothetical protein EV360DRAFT_72262 [Lentinula raphanica]